MSAMGDGVDAPRRQLDATSRIGLFGQSLLRRFFALVRTMKEAIDQLRDGMKTEFRYNRETVRLERR